MINYKNAQEVFEFVSSNRNVSKADSAYRLSQLYINQKIDIIVFEAVSRKIATMCGQNDVCVW